MLSSEIIPSPLFCLAIKGAAPICVINDDTNVFLLLLYYIRQNKIDCSVIMASIVANRAAIDIRTSAIKNDHLVKSL